MTAVGAAAAQATLELKAKKGERVCVMCRTGSEEGEGERPRRTLARPSVPSAVALCAPV